ncbi:uncharacterized protein LOC113444672 [Pseudonaja textilis]|uniref:uncharacterized protein LOC113444672 n=1 Tax=Pseudonaja textilis TaxID=8673 RepID=UPI000EA9BE5D|nr:uncharacterized protein LOC113444672 [Pseudonaja textilis]
MVTKRETEKTPVTDNIDSITKKLEQISLHCPGQFNVQSLKTHLKTSSQFGNLRQHSLTNSHQVIQIQGLNDAHGCIINNKQSEKTMIKTNLKTHISKMPGVQMPIGDPLPFPVPKLSVGPLSEISTEEFKKSAIRSIGATSSIESEKKEAAETSQRETQTFEETGHFHLPVAQAITHQLFYCMFGNNAIKSCNLLSLSRIS